MKNFKINFIFSLCLITSFIQGSTLVSAFTNSSEVVIASRIIQDGFIVMEDDIMRAATTSPIETIHAVDVFTLNDELVQHVPGCNSNQCNIDFNHLSTGSYKVVVTTSLLNSFSEIIIIQ